MVALHEREVSGHGQQVDLALYETVLAMQGRIAIDYLRYGVVRERTGNSVPGIAPGDVFRTADGSWLQISASGDAMWVRLAKAMGFPELIADERFASKDSRYDHSSELNELIGQWVGGRTAREVEETLSGAGVAWSPVMSIADVLTHPQVEARGNVITVSDDALGELRMLGPMPRFSRTPGRVETTGPRLGQHTEEILVSRLGLERAELDALQVAGVI